MRSSSTLACVLPCPFRWVRQSCGAARAGRSLTRSSSTPPELDVSWQLQRVGRQFYYRVTKTPGSDAPLPLPAICAAAIKHQAEKQATWQHEAGRAWYDTSDLRIHGDRRAARLLLNGLAAATPLR